MSESTEHPCEKCGQVWPDWISWHNHQCPKPQAPTELLAPIKVVSKDELRKLYPEAPTEGCDEHKRFLPHCDDCIAPVPTKDSAREWWIVETKHSFFIYEDELTANKEADSQSEVHGEAGIICVIQKSAYERLERELAEARAKPATFIKMDETTEAFRQTRAAIENMKQFQRDAIQARAELAESIEQHEHFADLTKEYYKGWEKERAKSAALVEALRDIVKLGKADRIEYIAREALSAHRKGERE